MSVSYWMWAMMIGLALQPLDPAVSQQSGLFLCCWAHVPFAVFWLSCAHSPPTKAELKSQYVQFRWACTVLQNVPEMSWGLKWLSDWDMTLQLLKCSLGFRIHWKLVHGLEGLQVSHFPTAQKTPCWASLPPPVSSSDVAEQVFIVSEDKEIHLEK